MLYGSIHPVLVPMVDFMSDGILDASEIPLPEGIGIDKDGASSDIYRLIGNLE